MKEKKKKTEEFWNSQGCTNMEGTASGGRELPVPRRDQAEKVDKTLNEQAAEGRLALEGHELPASRTKILLWLLLQQCQG